MFEVLNSCSPLPPEWGQVSAGLRTIAVSLSVRKQNRFDLDGCKITRTRAFIAP